MTTRQHARRLLAVIAALVAATCGSFDDNLQNALDAHAGVDATACGFADQYDRSGTPTPSTVQTCVLDALAAGHAFTASSTPASADGGTIIGWASDGTALYKLTYSYITGCAPVWGDDLSAVRCSAISRDADCSALYDALCLHCVVAPGQL